MTASCPHYRLDCDDTASRDCHYIKKTTASMVNVVVSLHMFGVEELSYEMKKYLQETETFLREMDIKLEK